MGYNAQFSGWDSVTIEDLLIAYRKAKADCFFENTFPAAIKFARYEQDVLSSVESLHERLRVANGFAEDEELRGDYRLLPNKLAHRPKDDSPVNGHVHFSNPDRAVEHLLKHKSLEPEFR